MKNLFKRIITTILVLTMVMGFNVPFSATTVMAASITYNVSSTIKGVLTDDGVLTISGTGAMPDYTKIANIPWYKDRDRISEVRVNSGITSIGEANFNSCYNMTKVTVASTVTSIGDGAFADTKLQSYTGMERVKKFGDYVFQGTDLDDFEFPGATTEIGNYIFYNSSVKRIVIPKSVTTIKDGIGYKAENLEKIEVSSNNKNYVAENYVLYNKNKTILESYPAAKTGTEFTIPYTVKTVTAYGFSYGKNLKKITITSGVTTLGDGAFYGMKALDEIAIPKNVTSIGSFLLQNCTSLKTLNFYAKVKTVPYLLCSGCSNLTKVVMDNSAIEILEPRVFMDCVKLSSVTLPTALKTIQVYAFKNCKALSTISYPKSITLIESGAFEGSSITKYPTWLSKGSNGDYGIFTKIKYKGTDKYSEAYKVLKIVNKERKSKGLSELKMDKDLLDVAMQRAAEVALYFSHTRPDGSSCFSATDKMEAENIAGGQSSADAVMTSWMNSAGHRANILTSYFKTIGIGCFTQGGTVFWVQCFGTDTPATISRPADKNVVVTVTVDGDFLSKTKLRLDSSSYNLKIGNKKTVKLYVQNPEWASQNVLLDNSNFTFKSYNTKKATISATGKINAKTVGKYKIKATLKNATGTSVTKSGKITFPQPKIKVTVKKKKAIVTWKKLKAAKGYYVYRREAKGKKYTKWKKVKNIKKNTTVKYKDSKLKKGKTYQYKVVAYNRKNKGTSAIKKIVIK